MFTRYMQEWGGMLACSYVIGGCFICMSARILVLSHVNMKNVG